MDHRKEPVHLVWHVFEVWWTMISYVDWFLTIAATELRNIGNGSVIQSPKRIFVEGLNPFF